MDGIVSIRMSAGGTDFISGRHLIRWTEVFLMPSKNPEQPVQDGNDPARAAGHLARAICVALTPNLAKLKTDNLSVQFSNQTFFITLGLQINNFMPQSF